MWGGVTAKRSASIIKDSCPPPFALKGTVKSCTFFFGPVFNADEVRQVDQH